MVTHKDRLDFVAIDVETANADLASICQVGIAKFCDGKIIGEWSSLVDPDDYFDGINIRIHGITDNSVKGKPKFPELVETLREFLNDAVCVSHTHFDRVSIHRALEKHGLPAFKTTWLDSSLVVRRAFRQFSSKGYGLKNVCNELGYQFIHHDALEDAKACGRVLLAAIDKSGLNVSSWLSRVKQPIDLSNTSIKGTIQRDGNPDGELYGEVVVFTGTLEIPRREAADMASRIGCTVKSGVTKQTTLLVVGDQDIIKLAGKSKSAKHLKAEKLIESGQAIRIVQERDFKELVKHAE